VLVLVSKVSRSYLTRPKCELIREVGGRGFGADMPIIGVPAREDAPLLGAVMVGVVAIVVGVVDVKTPVAKLPEQTLLLWVVGVRLVALEAVREGGGLTMLVFAQYKALVALHVIVIVFVLWPFTSNETGKVMSRRGGRAALVKMRDKVGTNHSMGEASLSVQKLTLKLLLTIFNGHLLPLAILHLIDVRPVPMDVSNDARVLKVSKCVVNKGASSVGGMEDVMVRVFRTRAIEIRGGERTHVEGE
jgi:hypothetical protein